MLAAQLSICSLLENMFFLSQIHGHPADQQASPSQLRVSFRLNAHPVPWRQHPLKPAQFPTSLHIYRKSDALRIASSCKLPKQLWETNRHLTFPHQHTNKERTLLPMAASAALRRQTHALFKTCHVTACTTTYAACSTEYMHGKNLCCFGSPQPHANRMLFNVPDGLGVLQ